MVGVSLCQPSPWAFLSLAFSSLKMGPQWLLSCLSGRSARSPQSCCSPCPHYRAGSEGKFSPSEGQ